MGPGTQVGPHSGFDPRPRAGGSPGASSWTTCHAPPLERRGRLSAASSGKPVFTRASLPGARLRHDGGNAGVAAERVEGRHVRRPGSGRAPPAPSRRAAPGSRRARGARAVGAASEYSISATTVASRVLSFEGNIRGSSARTWMSSFSIAVSVAASAVAAALTRGVSTRPAHASACARTSRSVSTASCTRARRSCACLPTCTARAGQRPSQARAGPSRPRTLRRVRPPTVIRTWYRPDGTRGPPSISAVPPRPLLSGIFVASGPRRFHTKRFAPAFFVGRGSSSAPGVGVPSVGAGSSPPPAAGRGEPRPRGPARAPTAGW